jgi:hypothetical protein
VLCHLESGKSQDPPDRRDFPTGNDFRRNEQNFDLQKLKGRVRALMANEYEKLRLLDAEFRSQGAIISQPFSMRFILHRSYLKIRHLARSFARVPLPGNEQRARITQFTCGAQLDSGNIEPTTSE